MVAKKPRMQPEPSESVYTYLTTQAGERQGLSVLLSRATENLLGRGQDCHVFVNDGLASRVHASVFEREGTWYVRDLDSRNGTFVDGRRISEYPLTEGKRIRIGGTEYSFHQSEQPPTVETANEPGVTQTIVRDAHLGLGETARFTESGIRATEQPQDLEALYQLSLRLWNCHTPQDVLRATLPMLLDRVRASAVGFLALGSSHRLIPHFTLPDEAAVKIQLGETMTRLVCDERRAVWLANQRAGRGADQPEHFADALCVPMIVGGAVAGAIYVYLERARFRQSQFELAIGVTGLTSVAWARARREQASFLARLDAAQRGNVYDPWATESSTLKALRADLTRAAATESTVLVTGEHGSGRRALARRIHRQGPRADAPLVMVDCLSAPAGDIEQILFARPLLGGLPLEGRLEAAVAQADLGTLVIHDVQAMSLSAQERLLKMLDGELLPPGETVRDRRVSVRLIATASEELEPLVTVGRFRRDLQERLEALRIDLPPLRHRAADMAMIVEQVFNRCCQLQDRRGWALSEAARNRLFGHKWPGNLPELVSTLDAAIARSEGPQVEAGALGLAEGGAEIDTLNLHRWERRLIGLALKQTGNNIPEAARLLGMGRATLYRKLEETQTPD